VGTDQQRSKEDRRTDWPTRCPSEHLSPSADCKSWLQCSRYKHPQHKQQQVPEEGHSWCSSRKHRRWYWWLRRESPEAAQHSCTSITTCRTRGLSQAKRPRDRRRWSRPSLSQQKPGHQWCRWRNRQQLFQSKTDPGLRKCRRSTWLFHNCPSELRWSKCYQLRFTEETRRHEGQITRSQEGMRLRMDELRGLNINRSI
jgi:hypothetical protein